MTILTCTNIGLQPLRELLARFGLSLNIVESLPIPGSYWGDFEAGLVDSTLYIHLQTPLHSALHEACHYICMDTGRRNALHTDAGGNYAEEDAVCYLQIILADFLPGANCARLQADMDSWGYTFRLGSARAWFEQDAEDACQWLQQQHLLTSDKVPTWRIRS